MNPKESLALFGFKLTDTDRPKKLYALACHEGVARVYEYEDNQDDIEALGNLIRTGDCIQVIYGEAVQFTSTSLVSMRYAGQDIKSVVSHGEQVQKSR